MGFTTTGSTVALALLALGRLTVPAEASPQDFIQLLESPSPTSGGKFGADLATDGTALVVGAPNEARRQGMVYGYKRLASGQWELASTVASPARGGYFGKSIAFANGTFAIAASHASSSHEGNGVVYLYDFSDPSEPQLIRGLTPSVSTRATNFGTEVAMNSRWLAVSASTGSGASGLAGGVVYLWEWSGSRWVERPRVEPKDVRTDDRFGSDLSLHGNRLLVKAHNSRSFGRASGAAYLFQLDTAGGLELARFDRADAPTGTESLGGFPNGMHLAENELVLADFGSRTGSRYALDETGEWSWADTAGWLFAISDYDEGLVPNGAYLCSYSAGERLSGYRSVHRTGGEWRASERTMLPPSADFPRGCLSTGRLAFGGGHLLSGATFYPPPRPKDGLIESPGSVLVWALGSNFFDPSGCTPIGDDSAPANE